MKVVYLTELDGDIDDVIAAEYLFKKNVLKSIVCDPKPTTKQGKTRQSNLENLGI